jgi:Cadherin domain
VQVSDGSLTDTQAIAVTVTSVNDNNPVITSSGGGPTASVSVAENTSAVATVAATDADLPGQTLTYSISGGADAARFTIDSNTGVLTFASAPNYEAPVDVGGNNVYDVTVQVSDGSLTDTQAIAITVGNVNEAPTARVPASVDLADTVSAGTWVATVTAADPDVGDSVSFALVIDGSGRFVIDASSGRIVVASGAALDPDTVTSFDLRVRVTDAGGLSQDQALVVSVGRVLTAAPVVPVLAPAPAPGPVATPPPAAESAAVTPPPLGTVGTGVTQPTPRGAPAASDAIDAPAAPNPVAVPIVDTDSGAVRPGARQRARAALQELQVAGAQVVSVSFDLPVSGAAQAGVVELQGVVGRIADSALRSLTQLHRGDAIDAELPQHPADHQPQALSEKLSAALRDPLSVASVSFTAGFVWWLTRAGGLLTTMLMGVPVWRHVDLMPVLAGPAPDDEDADATIDDKRHDELDEAALADLFDRPAGRADNRPHAP